MLAERQNWIVGLDIEWTVSAENQQVLRGSKFLSLGLANAMDILSSL